MSDPFVAQNPFMLMLQPEVVLAAVAKSERLSRLNRHLCRPLDRPVLSGTTTVRQAVIDDEGDDGEESSPTQTDA